MSTDVETRPFEDLRTTGLLWLFNFEVLHPLGYALAFDYHDGELVGWKLLGDGTEAWQFGDDIPEEEQQAKLADLIPSELLPEDALKRRVVELERGLDAFVGFAQRLAEAASMQEPSELVDNVEDLVDAVITKMLSDDEPTETPEATE